MKKVCLLSLFLCVCLMLSCCRPAELPDNTGSERPSDAVELTASPTQAVTEPETSAPTRPTSPAWPSSFTHTSVVPNSRYPHAKYAEFNAAAEPLHYVPALEQGFVPQGMDVWEEKQWLIISGYFPKESDIPTSMLFALDMQTGAMVAEYALYNADGSNHTGHVGGVAVTEKNLFLSNGGKLLRIELSQLTASAPSGSLQIRESLPVPVKASFCNFSAGILWVGDFYIPNSSNNQTPQWRWLTSPSGTAYQGWCVGYRLSDTENQLAADAYSQSEGYWMPDYILAIDQKTQGFTVLEDGSMVLSHSYGRKNDSTLAIYRPVLQTEPHMQITLGSRSLPVWFLDADTRSSLYTVLPMTEGVCSTGDRLLVLFESGAKMYREDGGVNPTDRVWMFSEKAN